MLDIWFRIDEKIRFIAAASFNMFIRFLIFAGLGILYSTEHYQILLALTWFISSFIAFACYKFLAFSAEGNHLHQYLKSLLIWIISYIINIFLLKILIDELQWNAYAAQGLAVSLLLGVNYLLFKHFAFKHQHRGILARIYDIFD